MLPTVFEDRYKWFVPRYESFVPRYKLSNKRIGINHLNLGTNHLHVYLSLNHLYLGVNDFKLEEDKSSDIEQQSPFGDCKISSIQPQNRGGGVQNQQEHHIFLTKYEAVHPTAVSENNSSSGMLIILTISQTVCINIYLKGPNNQRHSK